MKSHEWKISEQAGFLKRIGELLARGYPIAGAIESISFHMPDYRKEELQDCLLELKKGLPFHSVLQKLRFNRDLVGYVYFAEQHGNFAEALQEGSSLVLLKHKDFRKLFSMLQYPILLLAITGFLFLFLQSILIPKFTSLFTSLGLKANFFTRVIYAFKDCFPIILQITLAGVMIAAMYYIFIFHKFSLLKQRAIITRIPIIGKVFKLLFTHYFSIQLSFLLSGGISVSEALSLFENNKNQPFYSLIGQEIKRKLMTGDDLDAILAAFPFFEKGLPNIVKHGQDNGKLEQELLFFSKHCIFTMEEIMEKNLKTIQPILYLLIAFLVVSMYLAILLPMFHLLDAF